MARLHAAITLAVCVACGVAGHVLKGSAFQAQGGGARLITASSMGPVRLDMTLDDVRRVLPTAKLSRTSDGDGVALVEVLLTPEDDLVLWADEEEPERPIDWSKRVLTIETFSAAFRTREGVHPGSLVRDVVDLFGPVREIVKSEIEQREYVTFSRQPSGLTFRLDQTGVFDRGSRRTTRYEAGARILSIAVSSR